MKQSTYYPFVVTGVLMCSIASAFVASSVQRHSSPAALQVVRDGSVINLNDENYVAILRENTPVLVDIFAPWCGPCRLIEPVMTSMAQKYKDRLLVARYDVESNNPNFKVELVLQQQLPRKLPTLLLFQNGKVTWSRSGLVTEEKLELLLLEQLHAAPTNAGFLHLAQHEADSYMLSDYQQPTEERSRSPKLQVAIRWLN